LFCFLTKAARSNKQEGAYPLPPVENKKMSFSQAYRKREGTVLAIEVPKENEKTPLAAELLFASLHGIYEDEKKKKRLSQEHLSFEIEARTKSIRFYVWTPRHLRKYVEGHIYAQYPEVNIYEVRDYTFALPKNARVAMGELRLRKADFYPIKTFADFDVDPLAGLTAPLAKLAAGEKTWIQFLVVPQDDSWRRKAIRYIENVRAGKMSGFLGLAQGIMGKVSSTPGEEKKSVVLPPGTEETLKAIEEKSTKLGFKTTIRVLAAASDEESARRQLQLTLGAFKQFNTNNLNSFTVGPIETDKNKALQIFADRQPTKTAPILSVTELASLYHLPNKSVVTPSIVWAGAKKGEPPANLPIITPETEKEITVLAKTNFRGTDEKFGIKLPDRRRHIYMIGKSGVGKSTLLENMSVSDIKAGRGVALIDPHGEFVDAVMKHIPNRRINEVILFDPGDKEYPVAFNVLEVRNPKYKTVAASGVVGVFKKIFGDSWGPRLEYWLRNAILALLDYPNATLLMLPRLLTNKDFRADVIEKIQDPVLKAAWVNEFNKLDQRQMNETISPILNKVGQFLATPTIRNIVGQPKSTIDFREVMDKGGILLVKLSKGIIGEDNAALLGSFIITQIQLAALSRADAPEEKRPDFYLYVDEFQNFATDSFAVILSEARKYHLSLTVANQYMAQLGEVVRDSIFGNVGTLISFRVGADDAAYLEREFAPTFDATDLVNLDVYNIYIKLSIDGLTTSAFSAVTLPLPPAINFDVNKLIRLSRERYAKTKEFVESKIYAEASRLEETAKKARNEHKLGDGKQKRKLRVQPKIPLLKKVIARIEKKDPAAVFVPPEEDRAKGAKESKSLMDLLPGSSSIEEAFEKAKKNKEKNEEKINKGQDKLEEGTSIDLE